MAVGVMKTFDNRKTRHRRHTLQFLGIPPASRAPLIAPLSSCWSPSVVCMCVCVCVVLARPLDLWYVRGTRVALGLKRCQRRNTATKRGKTWVGYRAWHTMLAINVN